MSATSTERGFVLLTSQAIEEPYISCVITPSIRIHQVPSFSKKLSLLFLTSLKLSFSLQLSN